MKQFGEWVWGGIKGLWDWATGADTATQSTENLTNATEDLRKKQEEAEEQARKSNDSLQNLTNRVENLRQEQEKLREEYREGKLTIDEYIQKLKENKTRLQEAEGSLQGYEEALAIVRDGQKSYIQKIQEMNALKLNPEAYAAAIAEIQKMQEETKAALRLKQLLLDQALTDFGQKTIHTGINVVEHKLKLPSALENTAFGKKYNGVISGWMDKARNATTKESIVQALGQARSEQKQLEADMKHAEKTLDEKIAEIESSKKAPKTGG